MRRDVDRTEIPGGSAYNMIDFIPDEIQAVTGGRGGWTYAGPVLTGSHAQIGSLGYHPGSGKIVGGSGGDGSLGSTFALWDIAAGTSLGTANTYHVTCPPFFHRGKLIFPLGGITGIVAEAAVYYDGSTVSTLSTAPKGAFGCAFKDHAVLASNYTDTTNGNRVWFSAPGDPTTWDTSFGWWDTTGAVAGLAPLTNALLIFHRGSTERLRGTTPPPGSDMILEPFLPDVGCIDAFSIAYWQNRVVWASTKGIHLSDGATTVDLTASSQMKSYWQSLVSSYSSSWRIAGGIYRDHYIVSINNGSTLVDCLCVSLNDQTMWRFSNLHGGSFLNVSSGITEKLYMGQWNAGRVAELSSLWSPSSSVKQDGDGTNPTPIVETGMFRGFDRLHRRWIESMGMQKWRFAYVDYDLRDSASDNPTGALSYCTTPTGSYTQAGLAIPETTDVSRVRRSLSPTQGGATRSQMLGLKFAVTGPYASAKLYTLEGAFEPIEIGAL